MSSDARDALNVLASFPNLREIHLNEKTAEHLLGDLTLLDPTDATKGQRSGSPDNPQRYEMQRGMFYGMAATVGKARLNFFHAPKLPYVLACFGGLRSLRLQSTGTHQTLPVDLAEHLTLLPLLTELNLYGSSPYAIEPRWALSTWPHLTILTLRKGKLLLQNSINVRTLTIRLHQLSKIQTSSAFSTPLRRRSRRST